MWINSRWTQLALIWIQFLFNWLSLHNASLALAVWGMKVLNCRRSTMWSRSLGRGFSPLVAGIYATAFPQLDRPCQSLAAPGHIGHTGPTISIHPCCINPETPLFSYRVIRKWIVWPQPWNHPSLYQPLCSSLE